MKLLIAATVDSTDVMFDLIDSMSRQQLVNFVKNLDDRIADWDFTLELCQHFEKLKRLHKKEQAELL